MATLLEDVFDWPLALGTVQQIVAAAVPTAQTHHAQQELSGVRMGTHDDIDQAGRPVLVGVDADSISCSLLSAEDHCDADTWGVRLLELTERGLAPEATVADAAQGQRAGQALALPGVPCRGMSSTSCSTSPRRGRPWTTGLTGPWPPSTASSNSRRAASAAADARR